MGLFIILYKDNKEVTFFELEEDLHSSIFETNKKWAKTNQFRKLKDFYCSDIKFNNKEAKELLEEMRGIGKYNNSTELIATLDEMEKLDIDSILVSGD